MKLYGYLEGDGGIREVSPRTYTVVDRYVEAAKEEPKSKAGRKPKAPVKGKEA